MTTKTSSCLETVKSGRHRLGEEEQEGTMVKGILGTRPFKVRVLIERRGASRRTEAKLMCSGCSDAVRGGGEDERLEDLSGVKYPESQGRAQLRSRLLLEAFVTAATTFLDSTANPSGSLLLRSLRSCPEFC